MLIRNSEDLTKLGIKIWNAFEVSWWPPLKPVIIETPVQIRGGKIGIEEVGAFSYFGQDQSSIQGVSKIGRFCAFGPNLVTGLSEHPTSALSPHPMFSWKFDESWEAAQSLYEDAEFFTNLHKKVESTMHRRGKIEIGNDVWIGFNVYIAKGVKIGNGAVIATGSVVVKDVPPYTIVGGVPAKPIKQRFSDKQVEILLELKWWDYGPDILKQIDITDIEATIYAIEDRIAQGTPKYVGDKIEFNQTERKIYHISANEGERKLIIQI